MYLRRYVPFCVKINCIRITLAKFNKEEHKENAFCVLSFYSGTRGGVNVWGLDLYPGCGPTAHPQSSSTAAAAGNLLPCSRANWLPLPWLSRTTLIPVSKTGLPGSLRNALPNPNRLPAACQKRWRIDSRLLSFEANVPLPALEWILPEIPLLCLSLHSVSNSKRFSLQNCCGIYRMELMWTKEWRKKNWDYRWKIACWLITLAHLQKCFY